MSHNRILIWCAALWVASGILAIPAIFAGRDYWYQLRSDRTLLIDAIVMGPMGGPFAFVVFRDGLRERGYYVRVNNVTYGWRLDR